MRFRGHDADRKNDVFPQNQQLSAIFPEILLFSHFLYIFSIFSDILFLYFECQLFFLTYLMLNVQQSLDVNSHYDIKFVNTSSYSVEVERSVSMQDQLALDSNYVLSSSVSELAGRTCSRKIIIPGN